MAQHQNHSPSTVVTPTLFRIFVLMLQSHAFSENEDDVYLHTRSDSRLFNLARFRAKTKVRHVRIRKALFADDAALATHTKEALQRLVNCFAHSCGRFGLTNSIKKTEAMGQGTDSPKASTLGVTNPTRSTGFSTWRLPSSQISPLNQRSLPEW